MYMFLKIFLWLFFPYLSVFSYSGLFLLYLIILDACLFSNERERNGVDLGSWRVSLVQDRRIPWVTNQVRALSDSSCEDGSTGDTNDYSTVVFNKTLIISFYQ